MPFTSAQKRHYRRARIRNKRRMIWEKYENLQSAINRDDILEAVLIVCKYPQFRTQLLICNAQSILMCQALMDVGTPCNFWTLEGAETRACVEFIRTRTSIRG